MLFFVISDSAKRRQLPAWIREGLEKVEREKQKMLEKERRETEPQLIDSEAFNNYNKEDNSQATKDRAEIVEPETYPRRHSRFVSVEILNYKLFEVFDYCYLSIALLMCCNR